jgi:fucose 4-O-acetylase-like acetyltransferase
MKERILIAVYSSGVSVNVLGAEISAIGIPWFLVTLFLGRTLFDYLNLRFGNKKSCILCVILSVVGVLFGKIQWLPLSFDIALAILPFFVVGKEFYRFNVDDRAIKKLAISILVWLVGFLCTYLINHTYMELACRRYTLFPLCYIIAVAGTLIVSEISVIFCEFKKISKPICYLGKNSLYMLCIHIFDSYIIWIWKKSYFSLFNAIFRVAVDIIIFIIYMFVMERLKNNTLIFKNDLP